MTRVGTIPVDLVIPDLNVEQRYDAIKIETTPIRKKRQKIVTISVLIFVLPTSVRRFQSIPLATIQTNLSDMFFPRTQPREVSLIIYKVLVQRVSTIISFVV